MSENRENYLKIQFVNNLLSLVTKADNEKELLDIPYFGQLIMNQLYFLAGQLAEQKDLFSE